MPEQMSWSAVRELFAMSVGSVPPEPPDAGLCLPSPPLAPRRAAGGMPRLERHLGTGKPLPR